MSHHPPKSQKKQSIQALTKDYHDNPLYSNPLLEAIRASDYYGQPIGMNFENKQTHQTVFGGVITITVVLGFFSVFLNSMLRHDLFYLKDNISTQVKRFDYAKPHDSDVLIDEDGNKKFDFLFYMNDPSYDNDDNKFGKFIYHMYTNMEGPEDINGTRPNFNDIEIPLERCGSGDLDWRSSSLKFYCPKYDSNHFLHGGFSAPKYNWHRLILHLCDNSDEAKASRTEPNKECATRAESLKYFESKIMGLETYSYEASIDEEFSKNLYNYYMYDTIQEKDKKKQEDLVVSSRKDISYSTKLPDIIPYNNIGVARATLRYDNSVMEYFYSDTWKKEQTFLKLTTIDFA